MKMKPSTACWQRSLAGWLLLCPLLAGFAAAAPVRLGDQDYDLVRRARNDHYTLTMSLAPAPAQDRFAAIDLVFGVQAPEAFARLVWNADSLRVEQTDANGTAVLYSSDRPLPNSLSSGCTLELRRRPRTFELVADGRIVLRILMEGVGRGECGGALGTAFAVVQDVGYQRVEPTLFADDFMRTEEEAANLGLWKPASGTWKVYSVMERIYANPDARIRDGREPAADRSPNPFSLSGASSADTEDAVILTGYPFWNDYTVGVSVKSFGSDFGLIFAAADETDFWMLRWGLHSLGNRSAALQLVRRKQGVDTVLAETPVAGRAENWYRLDVRTLGGRIDVLVDGIVMLSHWDQTCSGGRIGLFAKGDAETYFDDVRLASVPSLPIDRADILSGHAQAVSGDWTLAGHPGNLVLSAKPETRLGFSGQALHLLGWTSWPAQCVSATVPLTRGVKQAGLVFAAASENDYWLALCSSADQGRVELRQVTNGRSRTLAQSAANLGEADSATLTVDCRTSGLIEVRANDTLVLRQRTQAPLEGRIGLYAEGRREMAFADIEAFTEPQRDWEHPVDIERFANDPYMQGWASPRYAWLRHGDDPEGYPQRCEHKGDFYGAFRITVPIQNGLKLFFGRDELAPAQGYTVETTIDASQNTGNVRLARAGKTLANAPFTPGPPRMIPGIQLVDEKIGTRPRTPDTEYWADLQVNRDGHAIWIAVDGNECLSVHEDDPLSGRTVGIETPLPMDFFHVDVVRDKVRDYLFEEASVDWLNVGEWEVTNRFACDPRWSHMNGRSKGVAALWNKLEFAGDYTIEYFAGMRMRQGDMMEGAARMYYPRVGDINIALGADGRDLFSGYNVLIAAWDPAWSETWTQFWRGDKLLDQTDQELIPRGRHGRPQTRAIEVDWDPGGRPIHGAWYAVKVRKTGNRYDVSFDNVPLFSITDPAPLAGRRIALWTQHNSIVIARVKIGYDRIRQKTIAPLGDQAASTDQPAANELPSLRCNSHPAITLDFTHGLAGVTPWNGDQSAEISRVETKDHGAALHLENLYAGGDFGVRLPFDGVDLARVSRLELDCAIPPDTKVNLYFTLADDPVERYFIPLSGPDHEGPNLLRAGHGPKLRTDGSVQHLQIDLAALLRRAFPWRRSFVTDSVVIGMLHEGYLNAGLGGNPAGAWYRIHGVRLVGMGPLSVTPTWQPPVLAEGRQGILWASRSPDASPPADAVAKALLELDDLKLDGPGEWYVHAAVAAASGELVPLPPVAVLAQETSAVISTVPAAGQSWGTGSLEIHFAPSPHALPDPASLALRLADTPVQIDALTATFDLETRILRLDPLRAPGVVLNDQQPVPFELRWADSCSSPTPTAPPTSEDEPDTAQTAAADTDEKTAEDAQTAPPPVKERPRHELAWKAVTALELDQTPPPPVTLDPQVYRRLDFNSGLGTAAVLSADSQVAISLTPRPEAPQDLALQVLNRLCGSEFSVGTGFPPVTAAQVPYLTFDYSIPPTAKIDIQVNGLAGKTTIGLTDREPGARYLGEAPGIVDDTTWRHAEVPLLNLLLGDSANLLRMHQPIQQIAFGNFGYAGDAPGTAYVLDNIALIPVVGTGSEDLTLTWACEDLGGIQGYSFAWSPDPETMPDTVIDSSETHTTFRDLPEGNQYFHIRACDRAGNWGAANHYRFIVDNTPPRVVAVSPANEQGAAASTLSLTFDNSIAAIDTSGATFSIDGKTRTVRAPNVQWDSATRTLSWNMLSDWQLLRGTVKDGQTITAKLEGIRDAAGNITPAHEWSWNVDYSLDKEGPIVPYLYSNSHNFRYFDHFADGPGSWRHYNSPDDTALETVQDPDRKSHCLKVTKIGDGKRFGIYRSRGRLDLDAYPYVIFDYRIMPGTRINLLVYVNRAWHAIRLTGSDHLPLLGEVADAADDGAWRRAWIDLREMLRTTFPDAASDPDVRLVGFGEWGVDNAVENAFYVDDFAFLGPSSPLPVFSHSSADASGIAGYEFGFDMDPRGPTSQSLRGRAPIRPLLAAHKPGLWYLHLRAQDGAGNWSEPIDYPYFCAEPAATHKTNGLETQGKWAQQTSARRTAGYVYSAIAGETNTLLGLQLMTNAEPNLVFGTPVDLDVEELSSMNADLFLESDKPLSLAAYVEVAGSKKRILSGKITLAPRAWVTSQAFEFNEKELKAAQKDDASPLQVREIGFVLYPRKRARDLVLFDQIMLNGELPKPEKKAVKKPGKKAAAKK